MPTKRGKIIPQEEQKKLNTFILKQPFDSVKKLIKIKTNEKLNIWLKAEIIGTNWGIQARNPSSILDLPRKAAVAHFRLITGKIADP